MSLQNELDELIVFFQNRTEDGRIDFVFDELSDRLALLASKYGLTPLNLREEAIMRMAHLLDVDDKGLRGIATQALFKLATTSDNLLDKVLTITESAEINLPGLFRSYDTREVLAALPVTRIESWLYRILAAIPASQLDNGFAFFCHEALFSYRDFLRLQSLNQGFVAGMLKDDLLMTAERLLGECYRSLGMNDRFTVDAEFNSCRLLATPREFEPMRGHWFELKKVSSKMTADALENLRYVEGLLFDTLPDEKRA